jgi:hypothetical protein
MAHANPDKMTFTAFPATRLENRPFSDPLTAEHRRELSAARGRGKTIRKAARVAAFNGWTTALVAAASAPFSLGSPVGLALSVGIAFVAFNEFRGRKQLLDFEPCGATLLGWNQLGLLTMITVYCLWMLQASFAETGEIAAQLKSYAELDAVLGSAGGFEALYKQIVLYFYGGVIGLSVLFQGGTALYYFSRRRHVEEYLAETPAWVREIERGAV